MEKLLIKNIGLLATPLGKAAKFGKEQGNITFLKDAWIMVEDGLIAEVGQGESPLPATSEETMALDGDYEVIDAGGALVTPGLVDAHTHLIFGGWRQNELGLKLHGKSYLEILETGGGILSTVKATREASKEELKEKAKDALGEMFIRGTTTVEAKSGYGLDFESEIKQLEAIGELQEELPMDIVSTYLGAHAIPPEYKEDRAAYIRFMEEKVIPYVSEHKLAEFIDVFCEEGVFTAAESQEILEAGKAHGLIPKIHADEIYCLGGTKVARDVGAITAEHLIITDEAGIKELKEGGVIACLLPGTSFYLNSTYANARGMIEEGVPVAICTDFNPGSCPCSNLQLVMNIGCLKYKMTPEEVLTAVTLNGAAAIRRADSIGTIEAGKKADLLIWRAPDLDYVCYKLGDNLVKTVIKDGKVY